jgi:phospholipase C
MKWPWVILATAAAAAALMTGCDETCGPSSCPSGCCSAGQCVTGTDSACGTGGAGCVACATGQVCEPDRGTCVGEAEDGGGTDAGVADAGSGCGTCDGCCDGLTCVPLANETNAVCGRGGACGACAVNQYCALATGTCHASNIAHVVLIVQENHTFDTYFGRYCTAAAGSAPTCTQGPACCEAAPATDTPSDGRSSVELSDSENYDYDRDHSFACEACEMDGTPAKMDHYTDGTCPNDASTLTSWACSSPHNWATASSASFMSTYWGYANTYALADRYFQPMVGSTSANDMYLAAAHYEFSDNTYAPNAIAWNCDPYISRTPIQYSGIGQTTIADLLIANGYTFGVYADGYADAVAASATGNCPSPPSDSNICPESFLTASSVCIYDPSDVPFQYYATLTDDPRYIHDLTELEDAVDAGTLPEFAYIKYRTSQNEHPGWAYISRGESNVDGIVQSLLGSPLYANNTLILLTWDEGGGFYDHVTPPPSIENFPTGDPNAGLPVPYGTRVPFLAIGPFVRAGAVSHVTLEHASVVRFLEWNFLGTPGALGFRDATVNDLGSLLDSTAVGVAVPECNASCGSRQCGLNGCGSSCGTCAAGQGCSNGACVTCATGGSCPTGCSTFACASSGTCYATAEEAATACGATCTACP